MRGSIPSANTGVVVLGNVLVGLLGSTVGSARDLVGDVVTGLLDGIHCDLSLVVFEKSCRRFELFALLKSLNG